MYLKQYHRQRDQDVRELYSGPQAIIGEFHGMGPDSGGKEHSEQHLGSNRYVIVVISPLRNQCNVQSILSYL